MKILVLNSGSSSQKTALYEIDEALPESPPPPLWEGKIEWQGEIAQAEVKNSHGLVQQDQLKLSSRAEAVEHLLGTLLAGETRAVASATDIDVVGHRVVHGGPRYEEPVLLIEVKAEIAQMSSFAPLHNRAELEGVEIIENW
jgi:acetate kinase